MHSENFLRSFLENVEKLEEKPCLKFKKGGEWKSLSWKEVEASVRHIALGLQSCEIKKGDRIALYSATRVEWTLCDLAILSLGAITVPIYHSNTADQVAYILQNSGCRLVFVENRHMYEKILSEKKNLPDLERVIMISGRPDRDEHSYSAMTLDQLEKIGRDGDEDLWREGIELIEPSEIATLVYTSGTTGPPKGAIMTHGNISAQMEATKKLFVIHPTDVSILFLPLAHILARVMQFLQLSAGFVQAYAESIDKLIENVGEVKPHFFASVPRIFEKIYERVNQQVESGPLLKKRLFRWALSVGRERSEKKQAGRMIGPFLSAQEIVANQLVFKKLKARFGGRLRFVVSGGAPLSLEIAQFLHAAGIPILEGYGLTETTAAINCNTLDHFALGTVGKPVYGAEEKIASDGEILVRGPMVFQGYYKHSEATDQVFTSGGWFKTGDIGEFDQNGFLKITDRKKDIIITAAGKNIAPQNIENHLKTIPLLSQVMVHGDKKKYLTALVTLNAEAVEKAAQQEKISFTELKELAHHPKIYRRVKDAIDEKNKQLASFEMIKKFAILENDFSQETGELTPTLKVKRKFVIEKYRDLLEGLYQ